MNKSLVNLRLRQMESLTLPWRALAGREAPSGGWIRAVRQALGMSAAQLGRRLSVTRQAVAELERGEGRRTITLATLERAANALDANLVYALVPRQSLSETRRLRARQQAERQLARVAHSMRLEEQEVSPEEHEAQVAELQERLLSTWSRSLWDDDA